MNANTPIRRILWADRAQIISMLLVVLHHSVSHSYAGPAWLQTLLDAIQYPALVCFFMISGMFATDYRRAGLTSGQRGRTGWPAYMKLRAVRLLTPWLCVNLLMLAPRYLAALAMGVRAHITPAWLLMSFLDPHGQGITPHLWFLPALTLCAALLPLMDRVVSRGGLPRLALIGGLLILSALPFTLPTLLCLNELKRYLGWYALGFALGKARGRACPIGGTAGLAWGAAGLAAFIVALLAAPSPWSQAAYMLAGILPLLCLAGLSEKPDTLTRLFQGRTYIIYILSMCVQNLVEVLGHLARVPWPVTFAAMFAAGLTVPWLIHAFHQRHPLPRWLALMIGL